MKANIRDTGTSDKMPVTEIPIGHWFRNRDEDVCVKICSKSLFNLTQNNYSLSTGPAYGLVRPIRVDIAVLGYDENMCIIPDDDEDEDDE